MLSFLFENRLFKLLYSNLGNRSYFALDLLFQEPRSYRTFIVFNFISMLSSMSLIFNALSNLKDSLALNLNLTTAIDLERLIVSGTCLVLMILELFYLKR